jgi:hypothetical protein
VQWIGWLPAFVPGEVLATCEPEVDAGSMADCIPGLSPDQSDQEIIQDDRCVFNTKHVVGEWHSS